MLTSQDIFNLYKKYKVSASKKFGQNFLVDHLVLNKIIEASEARDSDIIEIGPGLGSLTRPLLEVANSVCSYEIDQDMILVLKNEINSSKFKLIEEDFLKAKFGFKKKHKLVANIPYNITSDILFKLFKNSNKFESATIMIQKEVGQRLLAKVGSKEYGKLTLTTQLFAQVKKITIVKPSSFIPSPKVESMVVKLDFNKFDYDSNIDLIEFIKNLFAHRRKTLFNNLKKLTNEDNAKEAIKKLKLKENIRPQELSLDKVLKLFSYINNK